jgi:general secretion pathway protein G
VKKDEKADMKTACKTLRDVRLSGRRNRGFTAMEIAMVATVIAIFALLVIPLFRNRVEEAKIAAARADLASLMKAEIMAHADTGYYFRLEDLDNVINNAPNPLPAGWSGVTIETPPLVYVPGADNRSPRNLTLQEWYALAGTTSSPKWKGPYVTMNRTITYGELRATGSPLLRTFNGGLYSAIRDIPVGGWGGGNANLYDSDKNRIPIDPWGNPYLFFPPLNESSYNYCSIISLGPDGLPGAGQPYTRENLVREGADINNPNDDVLGTGDDLEVRF